MENPDDELTIEYCNLQWNNINSVKQFADKIMRSLVNKNNTIRDLDSENKAKDKIINEQIKQIEKLQESVNALNNQNNDVVSRNQQLASDVERLRYGTSDNEKQAIINQLRSKNKDLKERLDELRTLSQSIAPLIDENRRLKNKLESYENNDKSVIDQQTLEKQRRDLRDISTYGLTLVEQIQGFKKYSDLVAKWFDDNLAYHYYNAFHDSETEMREMIISTLKYIDILRDHIKELHEYLSNPDVPFNETLFREPSSKFRDRLEQISKTPIKSRLDEYKPPSPPPIFSENRLIENKMFNYVPNTKDIEKQRKVIEKDITRKRQLQEKNSNYAKTLKLFSGYRYNWDNDLSYLDTEPIKSDNEEEDIEQQYRDVILESTE